MKSYLNQSELIDWMHVCSVIGDLENTINGYDKKPNKSANEKQFLKWLRMAQTWASKAIELRTSFLSEDAKNDVNIRLSHLSYALIPNDRFRAEQKRLTEDTKMFHIEQKELLEWYEEVMPAKCGNCTRKSFEECQLKKLLSKYGFPVVFEGKGRCPYSTYNVKDKKAVYSESLKESKGY